MLVSFIIYIIFVYLHGLLQFVIKGEKREHCTVINYLERTVYMFSIWVCDWTRSYLTSLFAILNDKRSWSYWWIFWRKDEHIFGGLHKYIA